MSTATATTIKIRCPHCQSPKTVEIDQAAVDGDGQDVDCAACGEAFMIVAAKDGVTAIAL